MAAARKLKLVLCPLIIYCHYLTASAFDIQHVTGLRHLFRIFCLLLHYLPGNRLHPVKMGPTRPRGSCTVTCDAVVYAFG